MNPNCLIRAQAIHLDLFDKILIKAKDVDQHCHLSKSCKDFCTVSKRMRGRHNLDGESNLMVFVYKDSASGDVTFDVCSNVKEAKEELSRADTERMPEHLKELYILSQSTAAATNTLFFYGSKRASPFYVKMNVEELSRLLSPYKFKNTEIDLVESDNLAIGTDLHKKIWELLSKIVTKFVHYVHEEKHHKSTQIFMTLNRDRLVFKVETWKEAYEKLPSGQLQRKVFDCKPIALIWIPNVLIFKFEHSDWPADVASVTITGQRGDKRYYDPSTFVSRTSKQYRLPLGDNRDRYNNDFRIIHQPGGAIQYLGFSRLLTPSSEGRPSVVLFPLDHEDRRNRCCVTPFCQKKIAKVVSSYDEPVGDLKYILATFNGRGFQNIPNMWANYPTRVIERVGTTGPWNTRRELDRNFTKLFSYWPCSQLCYKRIRISVLDTVQFSLEEMTGVKKFLEFNETSTPGTLYTMFSPSEHGRRFAVLRVRPEPTLGQNHIVWEDISPCSQAGCCRHTVEFCHRKLEVYVSVFLGSATRSYCRKIFSKWNGSNFDNGNDLEME